MAGPGLPNGGAQRVREHSIIHCRRGHARLGMAAAGGVVVSTESMERDRLEALQRLCADAGVRTLHASIQFRDAADPG